MHPFLSQLRDAFANDYDEPSATGLGHGMRDAEAPLEGRAGKFILLMVIASSLTSGSKTLRYHRRCSSL